MTRQADTYKYPLLFAVALYGYPIAGNLVALIQVDSRVVSVPFRILVGLLSLGIIATSGRIRLDAFRLTLFAIWFVYCLRLVHDIVWTDLEGADYALQYFLITCVLPAVAMMSARGYNPVKYARAVFWVAMLGCSLSLLGSLLQLEGYQDLTEGGRLSTTAVNPVSIGHLAVSGTFCVLVLWGGASRIKRLWFTAALLLLVWTLVQTGSKGPMLALAICGGLWSIRRGHLLRFTILMVPFLILLLSSDSSVLAQRIEGAGEDLSTLDRVTLIADTLNQISESPLIGSAFVERNSGYYPHNVFLEAPMAMGIPMAIVFTTLIGFAVVKAWRALGSNADLLGLLFFQALLTATVAGALFGAIDLWIILVLLPSGGARTRIRQAGLRPQEGPVVHGSSG